FLGFWVWKSVAGDSEFAMRYLPLLGNLIGVAAVAAVGRRLFQDHAVALIAAALWAINPFQIWHAQDVRNYALWAGFSPLAMGLFLRAADTNRRRDWSFYIVAEAVALYAFFLEVFLLGVQALYMLVRHSPRSVLRRALLAWAVLGVILIPWLVQLWYLSRSGYQGTTEQSQPVKLITWFLPTLLTGDVFQPPWKAILPLAWCALVALGILGARCRDRVCLWLAAWVILPTGLLLIAATRTSIFDPRYLIAITPPLLLLMARAVWPAARPLAGYRRGLVAVSLGLLIIPLLGLDTLVKYYRGDHPKSPDWPALTLYLEGRARPGDLILETQSDPALRYYYHGSADDDSLVPGADIPAQLRPELNFYPTIWLIGRSPAAETFLQDQSQAVSFHMLSSFSIMQFRRWVPSNHEIATKTGVTFGDLADLKGYTIQGPDAASRAIVVLLYWEPLGQSTVDYKVFVHLAGPSRPDDGSPLWDQEDHPPLYGFASTLAWKPGTLYRDPYHLLQNLAMPLAPGTYTIQVGFYDPDTNTRLPVYDATGAELGDSYPLVSFDWPLPR
ncbi:MAG TPA: glycosyltransferase family 39 protein, partial [Aggregatilineaceae bacterium]|nr:glycosyltransferase family 39 protein [Aggregatilineaceae bacterium]